MNLIIQEAFCAPNDMFKAHMASFEVLDILHHQAKKHRGIARLGIEALALKANGASISEISRLYGTPANHIGAWISRAVSILRKDSDFLNLLQN